MNAMGVRGGARRERDQRGISLMMTAMMLGGFCGAGALALDVGVLYGARTSAQHAADAGAMAGAFTFVNSQSSQPAAAISYAIAAAEQNSILGQPVTVTSANITVDTVNQRVTVVVPRTGSNPVATYFAQAIGMKSANVAATATAEAVPAGTGSSSLKPLLIPNTALSTKTPAAACAAGETIFNSAGGLTNFALNNLGNAFKLSPTLPSNTLSSGQFYALDWQTGDSDDDYRCTIGSRLVDCGVNPAVAACGNTIAVHADDMTQLTQLGIGDLLGSNPDSWVGVGQYDDCNGHEKDTSTSEIVTAVYDNCSQTISPHNLQAKTVGFCQMFVDGQNNNCVNAHLERATTCSTTEVSNGAFGTPVRLVQTPSSN